MTDPSGSQWRVSIRWMPWTLRQRVSPNDLGRIVAHGLADADPAGCIVGILLAIVLVVLVPVVVIVGELVLLTLVVLPLAIGLAILGIRRWIVEVQFEGGEPPRHCPTLERGDHVIVQRRRGVRSAEDALGDLAERIERGLLDPVGDQPPGSTMPGTSGT